MSDFDKWFNEQGRLNGYPEDILLIKSDLKNAWNAGRATAERELRASGPCGVAGHVKADWREDLSNIENNWKYYCAACRREQEWRDALEESTTELKFLQTRFGGSLTTTDKIKLNERLLAKEE